MGIIKEYKYIYQHKKEWVQDDLIAVFLTLLGFFIFVGLMLLGTIVSGVLHYKFQKERNRGFFTF